MEKVELKRLRTDVLEHAPWNPRSAEELSWENPAMVELIASVKAGGVNQSLAVWDRGNGEPLLVIAGNRRLEAARAAGLHDVPAMVFVGITEARAHEITRAENEIRRGVDPLRDAELIGRMMEMGVTQKSIAAHFAMSEAMVCRRVKLLGLVPEIREIAARKHNIATDALEQMALYPADTQRKCAESVGKYAKGDSRLTWKDFKWQFEREMRELDDVKFDTADCVKCPNRTGAQPDLWGDVGDGKLGSCLVCDCYERHHRAWLAQRVAEQLGPDVKAVDAEAEGFHRYRFNQTDINERRSKKTPVAYWFYYDWSGKFEIFYGPDVEEFRERIAREDAAREIAAEEDRKRSDEERKRLEAERLARLALIAERDEHHHRVNVAVNALMVHMPENQEKFFKYVRDHIVGNHYKGSAAIKLAKVLAEWVYCCADDDEAALSFILLFPALVKALKFKESEIKEYNAAAKDLEKFYKEHEGEV